MFKKLFGLTVCDMFKVGESNRPVASIHTRSMDDNNDSMIIRWVIRRDLVSILHIEEECHYDQLLRDAPLMPIWHEDDYRHKCGQRDHIVTAVEIDGQVVGCLVYQLSLQTVIIHRLVVLPSVQRHGVGSAMIHHLRSKVDNSIRRRMIYTTVCEYDLPSQLFFKSVGFSVATTLRNHFTNPRSDGYKMRYDPDSPPATWTSGPQIYPIGLE